MCARAFHTLILASVFAVAPLAFAMADMAAAAPVAVPSAALPDRFFPLGKVRIYNGPSVSRPSLPAAGKAHMAVVGEGKYFPLPRAAADSPVSAPTQRKSAVSEAKINSVEPATKSLPEAKARHILSLFSPEEQD